MISPLNADMNPESGYITAQIVSFSAMLQGMTLGAKHSEVRGPRRWGSTVSDLSDLKHSWLLPSTSRQNRR